MKLLKNILVVCLLLVMPFVVAGDDLFWEAGTPLAMALERNDYEVRERFVQMNAEVLGEPGSKFNLNFFPDQSFSAVVTKIEQVGPAAVYHCSATELPDAHILISQVDSAFCITFSASGMSGLQATYAEAYTGLPVHRVVEIDPALVKFQCGVAPAEAAAEHDAGHQETTLSTWGDLRPNMQEP